MNNQFCSSFIFVNPVIHVCLCVQDDGGIKEHSILIKRPEQHIVKYPIRLGDEGILAPMSLFFPDLLTLHGDLAHVQKRSEGDPEDPHDEFYLKMTSREVTCPDFICLNSFVGTCTK